MGRRLLLLAALWMGLMGCKAPASPPPDVSVDCTVTLHDDHEFTGEWIQSQIDGDNGLVQLREGTYIITKPLTYHKRGLVIRGAGYTTRLRAAFEPKDSHRPL